jgi:tetratricopeptide (TPR) repeat protein
MPVPVPAGGVIAEPAPPGYFSDGQSVPQKLTQARQLYVSGRFFESAQLLEQVCAQSTEPVHLFNLGTANRRAGRASEAIASYRKFLERAPEHPQVPEARAYIHDMEVLLEERHKTEEVASQLSAQAAWTAQALEEARTALASERAKREQIERENRNRPVYKKAWFWGVVSGVVLATAVASVVGAVVANQQAALPPADTAFVDFSF